MNIVYAIDSNMVGPLGVSLKSLAVAHPGSLPQVFVLCGEVPSADQDRLRQFATGQGLPIVLIEVPTEALRAKRNSLPGGHVTFASLIRLVMGEVLPAELDRVLYLDADTLVMRPLHALFDVDMADATVAAVATPMSHLEHLGVEPATYVNTGVMLVDLQKWRKRGIQQACYDAIERHAADLHYWDQCALNLSLSGQLMLLDRGYNYIFDSRISSPNFELPHIVHYAGANKPWPDATHVPWGELYFEMSAGTPWPVRHHVPVTVAMRVRRRLRHIVGQCHSMADSVRRRLTRQVRRTSPPAGNA